MIYQAYIHNKAYSSKPTDFGYISKDITNHLGEFTLEEIAGLLTKGHTILPAVMNGERKKANFKSQQILMLDFDNKETNPAAMFQILGREFTTKHAAFTYQSFSSTPEQPKFRLVFVLDKPLTSAEQVEAMYIELFKHYPEADIACKDASRLFFGGRHLIPINYDNVLSTEAVAHIVKKPAKIVKKQPALKVLSTKPQTTGLWELIKAKDIESLKKEYAGYAKKLHSKVQVMRYMKTIPLTNLLGVEEQCKDIFHEDNTPSAGVFKLEDSEVWLYKCFSTNHEFTGDIFTVVAKLQNTDYMNAINFMMEVCNIEIVETEQIRAMKDQVEAYMEILVSEELKTAYPAIHGQFWRYKTDVYTILNIFKDNVYEDENEELRCLTWMSARTLSMRLYGTETKKDKVNHILKLMTATDWIDTLSAEEIPAPLLKKLNNNKTLNKRQYRSSVYEVSFLEHDFFLQLNKKCEVMKDKAFTTKANNREGLEMTFGKELANKVFVQDTDKSISKETLKLVKFMHTFTMEQIQSHGFVTEKDIMAAMSKKFRSKNLSERKFKAARAEMVEMYGLERKRLTKDLKKSLGIETDSKSMPTIYTTAA
ncbi:MULTISPECIES: hypothetical protein [Gammaproteobacteria]|uniref:hypothetical protein n=1 Tax=Acinetobacter sp. HRXRD-152 TaxID=3404808 RepID=UPI003BB75520